MTDPKNAELDNALAAATRAAIPEIVALFADKAAEVRAQLAKDIEHLEAVAEVRKTLPKEELEAALKQHGKLRSTRPMWVCVSRDFESVSAETVYSCAGRNFGGTYTRNGKFVLMSEADSAMEEMTKALDNAAQPEEEMKRLDKAFRAIDNYITHHQRVMARAANAERLAANAIVPGTFAVGETVQVHARGCWYVGRVVKLGRTKVTVAYTSGSGRKYEKAVDQEKIRKA